MFPWDSGFFIKLKGKCYTLKNKEQAYIYGKMHHFNLYHFYNWKITLSQLWWQDNILTLRFVDCLILFNFTKCCWLFCQFVHRRKYSSFCLHQEFQFVYCFTIKRILHLYWKFKASSFGIWFGCFVLVSAVVSIHSLSVSDISNNMR